MAQLRQVTMAFKIRTYDSKGFGQDVFECASFDSALERSKSQVFGTEDYALLTDNSNGLVRRVSCLDGTFMVAVEFDPCQLSLAI